MERDSTDRLNHIHNPPVEAAFANVTFPHIRRGGVRANWERRKGSPRIKVAGVGPVVPKEERVSRLAVAQELLDATEIPQEIKDAVERVVGAATEAIITLMQQGGCVTVDGDVLLGATGFRILGAKRAADFAEGRVVLALVNTLEVPDASGELHPLPTPAAVIPEAFHQGFLGLDARDMKGEIYKPTNVLELGLNRFVANLYEATAPEGFSGPLPAIIPSSVIVSSVMDTQAQGKNSV